MNIPKYKPFNLQVLCLAVCKFEAVNEVMAIQRAKRQGFLT